MKFSNFVDIGVINEGSHLCQIRCATVDITKGFFWKKTMTCAIYKRSIDTDWKFINSGKIVPGVFAVQQNDACCARKDLTAIFDSGKEMVGK